VQWVAGEARAREFTNASTDSIDHEYFGLGMYRISFDGECHGVVEH
jgi:hypothetical protein